MGARVRQFSVIFASLALCGFMLSSGCGGEEPEDNQVDCNGISIDAISPDIDSLTTHVFAKSCAYGSCHDASAPAEGFQFYDLATVEAAINSASVQDESVMLIAPGDPANSYIYRKITGTNMAATDQNGRIATMMPPGAPLCAPKIEAVRAWIEAGALAD